MILRLFALLLFGLVGVSAAHAADVDDQALELRVSMMRELRAAYVRAPAQDGAWIERARAELDKAGVTFDRPQLLVVVDRNWRVQQLMLLLVDPSAPWQVLGGSRVSTGQVGRFDHYITPTGVFRMTDAILGYRAEGTLNENGIRGLGAKGMRVWDFGWQVALKGWIEPAGKPDRTPIRLMLHATDPDRLEQRIGQPASEGCVRVPSVMNRFLDRHGVLDADYEHAAATDIRFRALLLPDRDPTPLAGDTLVVIDSGESHAVPLREKRPVSNQGQVVAVNHLVPSAPAQDRLDLLRPVPSNSPGVGAPVGAQPAS